jgi:hypothetical protein
VCVVSIQWFASVDLDGCAGGKGTLLTRMNVLEQGDMLRQMNERLVKHCMGWMCPEAMRLYGTDVPRSNCNQLVEHHMEVCAWKR